MTQQMKEILAENQKYNAGDMAAEAFGFSRSKHYDILVVAPGWKPTKILNLAFSEIVATAGNSYVSGYEVKIGDRCIAWAQTGAGACNMIDNLILCAELNFDKLVFLGSVCGLKKGFFVGDICTPSVCVEGTMAAAYLLENPADFKPFGSIYPASTDFIDAVIHHTTIPVKKASVFCTDSVSCEYYHLDFIRSFDTDLIEMETGAFYRLGAMLEKPAMALLVVSDNSANAEPLFGKTDAQNKAYYVARKESIPELLKQISKM